VGKYVSGRTCRAVLGVQPTLHVPLVGKTNPPRLRDYSERGGKIQELQWAAPRVMIEVLCHNVNVVKMIQGAQRGYKATRLTGHQTCKSKGKGDKLSFRDLNAPGKKYKGNETVM